MNCNVANHAEKKSAADRARLTVQTLSSVVAVVCLAAKPAPIYRPRKARQSPLYKTIECYVPEFERTYDERLRQTVRSLATDHR
jgi:hypothetical protein